MPSNDEPVREVKQYIPCPEKKEHVKHEVKQYKP
jgi:hypothetical protein